jgi:O-antigen ligase
LSLTAWLVQKKLIKKEPLLNSSSDWWLFLFFFACILSLIPAILYRVDLIKWFRELVPYLTLLLFFPLVEIATKRRVITYLALLFVVGLSIGIRNLWFYYKAINNAEFLWQLISFRETENEPILFVLMIVSLCMFLFTRSRWIRFGMLTAFLIFATSLFATFTRGYWLAAVIALFLFFIFLKPASKTRAALLMILLLSISLLLAELYLGDIFSYLSTAVVDRFTSIGESFNDVSVVNRLVESKAVWEQIKINPIMGYGLGKTYWFQPLIPRDLPTWYVHNGYLYLWYKTGLMGLIFFFGFYGIITWRGYKLYQKNSGNWGGILVLALTSCLLAMLVVNLTSPQVNQKDSLLIITLFAVIIDGFYRKPILKNT